MISSGTWASRSRAAGPKTQHGFFVSVEGVQPHKNEINCEKATKGVVVGTANHLRKPGRGSRREVFNARDAREPVGCPRSAASNNQAEPVHSGAKPCAGFSFGVRRQGSVSQRLWSEAARFVRTIKPRSVCAITAESMTCKGDRGASTETCGVWVASRGLLIGNLLQDFITDEEQDAIQIRN